MRRGEVRWYTFKAPDKRRPVAILTRDSAIGFLTHLTVAPITTSIRDIPSEVFLSEEDGLPENCVMTLDNVQTVPKGSIGARITTLSAERLAEAGTALLFALGFDDVGRA